MLPRVERAEAASSRTRSVAEEQNEWREMGALVPNDEACAVSLNAESMLCRTPLDHRRAELSPFDLQLFRSRLACSEGPSSPRGRASRLLGESYVVGRQITRSAALRVQAEPRGASERLQSNSSLERSTWAEMDALPHTV